MFGKLIILAVLILPSAQLASAAQASKKSVVSSPVRQSAKAEKKPSTKNHWRNNVIQVHPGDSAAFLLQGRLYGGLDSVRAIQYRSTPASSRSASARRKINPSQPSQHIRPRFSESTRQGRWVRFVVNKNAPSGLYWIEGYIRSSKAAAKALPVVVEVVPRNQKIRRTVRLPRIPAQSRRVVSNNRSKQQLAVPSPAAKRTVAVKNGARQTKPSLRTKPRSNSHSLANASVATIPLGGNPLQAYDPSCDLNSAVMQQILERGGSMPCAGNVSTSGPSNATYLLNHAPLNVGIVNAQLTINATNLTNPQSVRVSLAGQQLNVLSATTSRLMVALPNQPVSGALIVARSNGEVLGNLNNAYQVITQPVQPTALFDDFSGTRSSVSWKLGYQMSLLSWLAYFDDLGGYLESNEELSARLGVRVRSAFDVTKYGFDVCHIASGSMQGVVFEHEQSDSIIVSIRGSQTGNAVQDWWDNDLDPQPFPRIGWAVGSSIHCGFHQAAKVVYDELLSVLKDDASAGKKIWITGHSLGGASAILLAAMLEWDAGVPVTGVYTFGAPGVGSAFFVNAYNDDIPNTHRFELQLDPAASMFFPLFGRPGRNHLLHANGSTSLNANQGYLVYPSVTPISDLLGTHMQYWCRGYAEMDEATSQNLMSTLVMPPENPDGSGVCETASFYGSLP